MTHRGGCHCGAVRFEVRAPARVTVQRCNCSMCTRTGFQHLIVPGRDFTLLQGADAITTYTFNTGVAKHTFCKVCGMHPFYVPRSDPDKIDVNARCLDDIDLSAITPKEFDGRHWEEAMRKDVPWR